MSVARYNLRASPATGVGGMFATAQGEGMPVRTAALDPNLYDQQNWAMLPGSIPKEEYRVCLYNTENNFSLGWAPAGEQPKPGEPLVLSEDMDKHIVWILKKFDAPDGVQDAYTLRAATGIIGSTWYAGTNDQGQVVIVPVPVIPKVPVEMIPYWVLMKN